MRLIRQLAILLPALLSAPASAASLAQMAGQMIVVGFAGDTEDAPEVAALASQIERGELGGVILLKTNISDLDSVRALNARLKSGHPFLPPFIALDQEGGQIERLTAEIGFTETPSAKKIAATETPAEAETAYSTMASALAALGFNLNFGPVVDLNINPDNPIIARYERAYGADPELVATYAEAFIKAHRGAGVLTALKHFPGHGSSREDSHEGFVDITDTWKPAELVPYQELIARNEVDMIMVGHLFHAKYGGGAQTPASLSADWQQGVLRTELHYQGVIISDDLEMAAIRKNFTFEDTIIDAVTAGTDILLFSNTARHDSGLAARVRDILIKQAQAHPLFRHRIAESFERIERLKASLGR